MSIMIKNTEISDMFWLIFQGVLFQHSKCFNVTIAVENQSPMVVMSHLRKPGIIQTMLNITFQQTVI